MAAHKRTLGQSIDEVVAALEPLDEAARMTAVRAACEHLEIAMPSNHSADTTAEIHSAPENVNPNLRVVPAADIRTLRTQKNPKSDIEMACIVAYYLESLATPDEQKPSIGKADVDKYFKQAGNKLPKRSDMLLVNAKAAGYFDSSGRGKYKLNPVGHNLVVHTLPRAKS